MSNRIVKNPTATTIVPLEGGGLSVTYHTTEVVRIEKGAIILNSGGHKTAITKHRMNQYTPKGIDIYQHKDVWWVYTSKGQYKFADYMEIRADGEVNYTHPKCVG